MPIPEGNQYLPKSEKLVDVYQQMKMKHFRFGKTAEIIKKQDQMTVSKAAGDYFTTGVAYLANRGQDDYMREVGTITWRTVNQNRVLTAYTETVLGGLVSLGAPITRQAINSIIPGEPYVVFMGSSSPTLQGNISTELMACVLIPPEFLQRVQEEPILALSTMAYIGSQTRDLANGRLFIDQQNMQTRALATEAHFLHHAVSQIPGLILPHYYQNIMTAYPEGIASLPLNMQYKGISGNEYKNAKNN